mgnify:CR=1 FL=1|tara:strand:+ start:317 stop:1465 length:1149 start_codon:yes stop_codon:yes gene_type:complete
MIVHGSSGPPNGFAQRHEDSVERGVAVCFTGQLRTAMCRLRNATNAWTDTRLTPLESLHANVLSRLGRHETFAVLEDDATSPSMRAAISKLLQPIGLIFANGTAEEAAFQRHLQSSTAPHAVRKAFGQAYKLGLCWGMLTARELALGTPYSVVLKARPDVLIPLPINVLEMMRGRGQRCAHDVHGGCPKHSLQTWPPRLDDGVSSDLCLNRHAGSAPSCVGPCSEAVEGQADVMALRPWSPSLLFNDIFYVTRRDCAEPLFNHLTHFVAAHWGHAPRMTACGTCGNITARAATCSEDAGVRLGSPAQSWLFNGIRHNDSGCQPASYHEEPQNHSVGAECTLSLHAPLWASWARRDLRLRVFNGDMTMRIVRPGDVEESCESI